MDDNMSKCKTRSLISFTVFYSVHTTYIYSISMPKQERENQPRIITGPIEINRVPRLRIPS